MRCTRWLWWPIHSIWYGPSATCWEGYLLILVQLNDVISLLVGLWAVKVANEKTNSKRYTYGVSSNVVLALKQY